MSKIQRRWKKIKLVLSALIILAVAVLVVVAETNSGNHDLYELLMFGSMALLMLPIFVLPVLLYWWWAANQVGWQWANDNLAGSLGESCFWFGLFLAIAARLTWMTVPPRGYFY
jgi:hypothetical protein